MASRPHRRFARCPRARICRSSASPHMRCRGGPRDGEGCPRVPGRVGHDRRARAGRTARAHRNERPRGRDPGSAGRLRACQSPHPPRDRLSAPAAARRADGGIMRILLAEDDAVAGQTLTAILTAQGHEVTAVDNGVDAWGLWLVAHHRVIVSDWLMPAMDGIELCRKIRSRPPGPYTYLMMPTIPTRLGNFLQAMQG